MTAKLILSLACNHHENGTFAGKFDAAEVHPPDGETLLRLYGPGTRVAEITKGDRVFLRVGRVAAPYRWSTEWYGNWCWDAWALKIPDAVKVLNYLKSRGFDCEEGESTLFERWKQEGRLTEADLEAAMMDPED